MKAAVRVTIRAWNDDGFHRDIAVLDETQVRLFTVGMDKVGEGEPTDSIDAVRLAIVPDDFSNVVRFEVIVERLAPRPSGGNTAMESH